MAVFELNLASIQESLDGGRINEAVKQELRRVVLDMEDRPADDKPRTVELKMTFVPQLDDQGLLDSVNAKFVVTSKVPARRSRPINFGVRRGGMLVFNDLSEDDIHQGTIE